MELSDSAKSFYLEFYTFQIFFLLSLVYDFILLFFYRWLIFRIWVGLLFCFYFITYYHFVFDRFSSRFFISLCGFSEDIAAFLKISRGLFATSAESWRCAASVANPRVQFQTWITIGDTLMWFSRSLLLAYLFYPQVGGHDLVLQVLKWERERERVKHQ